ncbi:FkbM family methyltransferase [Phenylobacterium sp.]|uniref:FkbM family methyltransferase n=1 Tax=Phenylobacterium sp. TaxID=1871053 RepID=UPI0025E3CAC2|nr:FkbM family methyltransferase [Phenylobacterium sp.]
MQETTTAYGLTFEIPPLDTTVGRYLRDYGEFARPGVELAAQLSRGGGFVDVGANIGAFALPVASSAVQVVAIEAHPGLARLLASNVARNGLANVQVVHAAASDTTGIAQFPTAPLDQPLNYGAGGFRSAYPVEAVPMVTLDEVVPGNTACVKIDVEGHELRVLRGAARVLRSVRPAWLIECPDTPESKEVMALMIAQHYVTYWFFTPFFTPLAPRNGGAERIQGDINVLAIPAERPQPKGMYRAVPTSPRPSSVKDFPYLAQFGFV